MINLNLSLFLLLCVLYFILYLIYSKDQFNTENNEKTKFLLNLDKYYVDNVYFIYFMTIFYFIANTLIFILLRIQRLGLSNIVDFSVNSLTVSNVLNIIIFILNINIYFAILNIIFYPYILKLHFYLYQKEWYVTINDYIRDNEMIMAAIFTHWFIYCDDLHESKIFIQKNRLLLFIFKTLSEWFFKISVYISRFISYIPHLFVICIAIYDLYHSCLHYIYYMLCVFLITNIIKKSRRFLYVKDVVYDTQISDYFYKNKDQYVSLRKNIFNITTNSKITFKELEDIIYYKDEIISYFKNDFQVYYILDPERKDKGKRLFSRAKRLHMLLLLFLGNIFVLYFFGKYQIIFLDMYKISPAIILIPLFLISYLYDRKLSKKIALTSTIFYILFIIQIILLYYIILKNRITSMPSEMIFDINYFKLIEIYSIEDKRHYLEHYLNMLNYYEHFDQITTWDWTSLKEKIKTTIEITLDTSLQDIRDAVNNHLIKYAKNPKQTEFSFIQKIFIWMFGK